MSVLPAFDLVRAETLDDALAELSIDSMPLGGGTELLLAMRMRVIRPEVLVDLKRIPTLAGISLDSGTLVIGGGVTHHQAAVDPLIKERLPILPEVLHQVGNPRIRASGTLAGNLVFAEPKSDVITILRALDAQVVLVSSRGSRQLDLDDLILGPYFSAREPDEVLTEIRIPIDRVEQATYVKYQTMERPTVGVAALDMSDGSRRVVVGAVGERTLVTEVRRGDPVDSRELASLVEPIPDISGSARYKRQVTGVTIERALTQLAERN